MSDLALTLVVVLVFAGLAFSLATFAPPWLASRAIGRAGLGGGHRRLGRRTLGLLAEIDAVSFDKHRTLTTGELVVVSVDPLREDADRDLRWFAGALEHHAKHPIGQAIARLSTRGNVTQIQEVSGFGISGCVDRHPVRVGRPSWLGIDAHSDIGSIVAVEVDARAMGTITVADEADPAAPSALARLRDLGVTGVYVSSDSMTRAKDLANRVGVDHVVAEVTRENRPEVERRLAAEHGDLAHVGDGGASVRLADRDLAVAAETAPLEALAESIDIARALPARLRTAQALVGVLTVLVILAAFALL